MARRPACTALVGMLFLSVAFLLPPARAGEADVKTPAPQISSEEAIEKALDGKITFEFDQTPLREAVDFFKQLKKLNIAIDEQSLSNAGILNDAPVTLHVKDATFRSALRRLLASVGLAYIVQDEVLQITTPNAAAAVQSAKTYDVNDLVKSDANESGVDVSSLIDVVQNTVMPESWSLVGGSGSISDFDGLFIVSQTAEGQQEVANLLRAVREARQADPWKGDVRVATRPISDESKSIRTALDKRVTLKFDATPLSEVAAYLQEQYQLPIVLDIKGSMGLEESGIALDSPVTVSLENVRLASALKHALHSVSLTYIVQDDFVMVVTPEKANATVTTAVYGVRDLIESAAQFNGSDAVEASDELSNLITMTVMPQTWDEVGGQGRCNSLTSFGELVVSQSEEAHVQIQALLKQLRQAAAARKSTAKRSTPRAEKFNLVTYTVSSSTPATKSEDGKETTPEIRKPSAAELEKLLPELVAKGSWDKPQVLIRACGDQLFVRQTAAVHRELSSFLGFPNGFAVGIGLGGGGGSGFFSVPNDQK